MQDKRLLLITDPPAPDYVKSLFLYNEETGLVHWKVNKNKAKIGDLVGTKHNKGYLSVSIDSKNYLLHRVVWCIHYGEWPTALVDHKDTDKKNNKISNLRLATSFNNAQNANLRKDSTSNIKGVSWHKRLNKWQVRVQENGKRAHLGYFDSLEEAKNCAISFRIKLHKEFTNHG